MPRHTIHRKDGNHGKLMALARLVFPVVEDHSNASLGYDAIWANGRDVWVVEIKPPGKYKLTDNEAKAQARWDSRFKVVQDEAGVRELAGVPVKRERIPEREETNPPPPPTFQPADLSRDKGALVDGLLSPLARRAKRRGGG